MAISRAQLEQQIQNLEGGGTAELKAPLPSIDPSVQAALDVDLSKNREKFGMPSQQQEMIDSLNDQILSRAMPSTRATAAPFDFNKSFDKYSQRLAPFFSQSTRPTFYDMASDLGAAMLSADPTAGVFRSAGMGFSNFNERLRKDKESRLALDRQVGLQAMQMAMADERAATDYLNKLELERIKLSGKPYDPLIYEITDPVTGETKVVEVDPRNQFEIDAIRNTSGAKQIKLPDSQITIDSRSIPESSGDKESAKTLIQLEATWADEAKQGLAQNQLTSMFLYQLQKLGPENFGSVEARTLAARQILSEMGIAYDNSKDETILADQQLVNTLGTRISMALVGQTKGAISNAEMELFLRASPTLVSTYAGALKQAALLQRMSNLNIKRAEDWNEAVKEGALSNAETAADQLRAARSWELKWQRENPFLTTEETSELRKAAAQEDPNAKTLRTALRPEKPILVRTDFSG